MDVAKRIFLLFMLAFSQTVLSLPAEMIKDLNLDKLKTAVEAEDWVAAKNALSKLDKLKNLKLPDTYYYYRAEVMFKNNDYAEALAATENYLNRSGNGGRFYKKALQLYDQSESGLAEQAKVKKALETIVMIPVPAGCFQMGSSAKEANSDESPVHRVCVDGFAIGKYEVTQGIWQKVMGANPSYFSACGADCPVEQVSWDDVQTFLSKLNSQTGQHYRLPTEAEWEYACRSGGKDQTYCGGNNLSALGWYYENSGSKTHPVGQKQANELGLYDMSGNVWEWVQDWYSEHYYKNSPAQNPAGPSGGSDRVLRGGSWDYNARRCRAAIRFDVSPGYRNFDLGFRLARTR